jgi:lariat debranching enzyme
MEAVNIAVEGCCHGELDKIYETVSFIEKRHDMKIDLLICCGDFQAVRNTADLECMAVPVKYRQMQTFYKVNEMQRWNYRRVTVVALCQYYSGEKVAPVLTLFIGGNHEASNHLWEL